MRAKVNGKQLMCEREVVHKTKTVQRILERLAVEQQRNVKRLRLQNALR